MPRTGVQDESDPTVITKLMEDFKSPSQDTSKHAFRTLVKHGSPIRDIIASSRFGGDDGIYFPDDMAKVINEPGVSDAKVFTGLARAITGAGGSIRLSAIQVCRLVNRTHPILLEALIKVLNDRRENVRVAAAQTLGVLRSSEPAVLKGLATALKDPDASVAYEAIDALRRIGAASPDVLEGLLHFLNDVNSDFCGTALYTLKIIGVFDPSVIRAIRQVATSKVLFGDERPTGHGDDWEHGSQYADHDELRHEQNRQQAVELLTQIPIEELVQKPAGTNTVPRILSAEDEQILVWFKDVDLTKYRTPLQVFWCIGYVDKKAIESAGPAKGFNKLTNQLRKIKPRFKEASLPTGVTSLRHDCLPSIDGLFDREPFYSKSWSEEERGLPLRTEFMRGKRHESRWTLKARKAWAYVDQFLTLKDLLPTVIFEGG